MNSILTVDAEEGKVSFIIPYIVFVYKKDNQIEIILNCPSPKSIYSINFPGNLEADGAYLKIMSIIESYYNAMMRAISAVRARINKRGIKCRKLNFASIAEAIIWRLGKFVVPQ